MIGSAGSGRGGDGWPHGEALRRTEPFAAVEGIWYPTRSSTMTSRPLQLGRIRLPTTSVEGTFPKDSLCYELPTHHLVTHGVCVGMTGSGKTGLCIVLVEEALRSRVPVVMLDIKGDLANLMLTFPRLSAEEFAPWIDADGARRMGRTVDDVARETATRCRDALHRWGLGVADVAAFRNAVAFRVITPGTTAAEPLHVLSALEAPSTLWDLDDEAARESLSAALSLLLRMIDHEADPAKSREHVFLALLAERRLRAGETCSLESLVAEVQRPPLARVGALSLDDFISAADRAALAQSLNTLIASPTFATWRQGAPLDPGAWLAPRQDGKTPAVIVSVAHLDDTERSLVLSLVLEQLLAWVRSLPGTSDLRALVLFDEVFGFLPPHPASPPTKRPLMALLKQARAFGVGLLLATQNPMDLDYKALSNAGVWFVGRLQTDADRARVVEGLSGTTSVGSPVDAGALGDVLKSLPPRTFYVRNVHDPRSGTLLEVRSALSWLRGPMTRQELRRLVRFEAATSAREDLPERLPVAVAPVAPPMPLPPTRVDERASPRVDVPAAPEGWLTWHGPFPPGATPSGWIYQPWVASTIIAHVRDAKLNVQVNRTVRAMAPLTSEGRPDTARGRVFDPSRFAGTPVPGLQYAPLPDALFRKNGPAAVVRALRDEVYRSLQVSVQVHRGLGLVSSPEESAQAFAQRVAAEALRQGQIAHTEILQRHAPKVQRAADAVAVARAALAAAEQASPTGGALAAAAAFMRGGRRALQRIETQQDRQAARVAKAREDLAHAEADLREALAKRDADLAAVARQAQLAPAEIETRNLAARKEDIEVTEVGVAWVPTAL